MWSNDFNNGIKTIQQEKDKSSTNGAGISTKWISTLKRMKFSGAGWRLKRERVWASLWLIPAGVQQTPTQHCKVIILPLKIKIKKNEVQPLPNTISKINSKWTKYLNVTAKAIKFLEENTGQSFTILDLIMFSFHIVRKKSLWFFQ